jgi:hypothetical protein
MRQLQVFSVIVPAMTPRNDVIKGRRAAERDGQRQIDRFPAEPAHGPVSGRDRDEMASPQAGRATSGVGVQYPARPAIDFVDTMALSTDVDPSPPPPACRPIEPLTPRSRTIPTLARDTRPSQQRTAEPASSPIVHNGHAHPRDLLADAQDDKPVPEHPQRTHPTLHHRVPGRPVPVRLATARPMRLGDR